MSQKISLRKNNCKKFINQPKNSSLLTSDLNKFTPLSHLKPCSTNINNFKNNQPKKKSNSMASINSTIKKINELSKKKNTNPLLNSTINKSKLTKNTTKSDSINNLIDINISVNYKNISLNENKLKQLLSNSKNHTKNDFTNNVNRSNLNINNIHNICNNINSFNNTINNNSITNKSKYLSSPFRKNDENLFSASNPKNKNRKSNFTSQVTKNSGINTINSLDESQNKTQINNKIKCYSCKNIYSTPIYMKSLSYISNNNETKNDICTKLITNMNKKLNKLLHQSPSKNISKNNEISENVFSIIKSTFYKFGNLCDNEAQKKLVTDIISALNQYKILQITQINKYEKENEELFKKNRELKKENLKYQQQNIIINNKHNSIEKELNVLRNKLKNINEYINEGNNKSKNSSPNSSYVNTEELDSIRFFDKIIMEKHIFSKTKIPELSFEKIKLNYMKALNNKGYVWMKENKKANSVNKSESSS